MEVTIRAVEIQDARAIHRLCTQNEVLPYMVFLPSMRVDAVENRIRNLAPNQFEFVAEYDGAVVGFVGLSQGQGRRSHSGDLFIGVNSEYHNKGIGKALLMKMLDLADNWLLLERVELGVLETNLGAKALYEKFGFVEEGIKKGSLKAQGKFVDEIMMSRLRPNGLIVHN
ncbi:GNAT family N-acetyltransferase [Bacillus pseudomycoides]|uniref:GNAT family N-acetyltransferase n=1 Tax=Bacillus pseudomycoides TaxID=64104 RepID=A0AA91ZQZ4_9BACI|nr:MULTISPECIES: GNAT family N-acetyltransferase [Bacillus]PEB48788.1 GNAT family N-acetyltransferase [Bacillus sp. AFS098217]PED79962.1 GNAT family N-acetyltransferase [Bacillus pseudomycoides]PEU05448.1 GNAT family N-acetyltransferase [Bacillus sp. AFS019443]PEU18048.1 GNAT family N-acetyltransferase [Bacillus sp. AFS014408]PFW62192.1 GNAT family N-acetyltransferase [Bacillus sp. AFS075034]